MCGIAGVVNLGRSREPAPTKLLARMAGALHHRGPDEFGMYRDERAALVHTRLAIVDVSGGQQPMANEDERVWVVFNGEIFNFVELRAELEACGHVFRTRSDTEVIVHAWESWGARAFDRFNGQWAIALWDAKSERLVLARDRVGVRPLHYVVDKGRLLFASEVKALFADPTVPRAIDPCGLDETFTFWSVLAPRTLFRGVFEIPPGHWLMVDARNADVRVAPYWAPTYPSREAAATKRADGSLEHATEALREKLEEATRVRMVRADVPVGAYVSGGLDSSIVAALAMRHAGASFKTFSLRFADAEYDETPFQREMVQRLGSEHAEIVVTRDDIVRAFPDVIFHTERPLLRAAPAPLYLLSNLVRAHGIKVVLTGEGADEMLGGYDLFREDKIRRFWARQPASRLRPRLFERLYPYLARSPAHARGMAARFWARALEATDDPQYAHRVRWDSARALTRLFAPAMRAELHGRDPVGELLATLPAEFSDWEPLARAQYLEVRTLLSGYLLASQGDRVLMAHSVEGRFPFLDRDVMAFANALPANYKLRGLDEKHILKRAAHGLVPASIVRRTKQPYRAPDALAFVTRHGLPEYVGDALCERAVRDAGLFDPRLVRALVDKCIAHADAAQFSNADNMAFLSVLSAQLLDRQFVAESPVRERPVRWTTCVDRVRPRVNVRTPRESWLPS